MTKGESSGPQAETGDVSGDTDFRGVVQFVLFFDGAPAFSFDDLARRLEERYPALGTVEPLGDGPTPERQELMSRPAPGSIAAQMPYLPPAGPCGLLLVDGEMSFVMDFHIAFSDDDLAHAQSISKLTWPTAKTDLAKRRGQTSVRFILPRRGKGGDDVEHNIAVATAATCVAAEISREPNCLGALNYDALVLSTPKQLQEAADTAIAGKPPIETWVGFHIQGYSNPTISSGVETPPSVTVHTHGLRTFVDYEVSFMLAPTTIDRAFTTTFGAVHLALSGSVLKDWDTIGDGWSDRSTVIRDGIRADGAPVRILAHESSFYDPKSGKVALPDGTIADPWTDLFFPAKTPPRPTEPSMAPAAARNEESAVPKVTPRANEADHRPNSWFGRMLRRKPKD